MDHFLKFKNYFLCFVFVLVGLFVLNSNAQHSFVFTKTKLQKVAYSDVAPSAEVYSVAVNTSNNQKFVGGVFRSLLSNATPPRHKMIRLSSTGSIDTTFGESNGFNGGTNNSFLSKIIHQSSGKFVVIGNVTAHSGTALNGIARLSSNGNLDNSFNSGAGLAASTLRIHAALQSDDKIIICGLFTAYNGFSRNNFVRINADGSIDNSMNVGTAFPSGAPAQCALQADGKVIVVGGFTEYNGTLINGIIRINSDGTVDGSFNVGSGFVGSPSAMVIQADGKIVVAGNFTSYNGTSINRIVRLNSDGTIDGTFSVGTGFDANVTTLGIQNDGKIYASGLFTTYQGTAFAKLIRLNTDGSIDNTLVIGTGFDNYALSIVVQADNNILLGGNFTSYNGSSVSRIVRISSTGTIDPTFVIGTGFDGSVYDLYLQADGRIVVAGVFDSYNGLNLQHRLAVYDSKGAVDTSLPSNGVMAGVSGNHAVYSSAYQPDGKIIVGGFFAQYAGSSRRSALRLNTDGTVDAAFVSCAAIPLNGLVRAMALQSDGKIIYSVDNLAKKLIRVDSTNVNDAGFNVGTGFDNTVYGLALQSDGKVITTGSYANFNGGAQTRIARLNTNGTLDATFVVGSGLDATGYTTSVQADGKVLVGGSFTNYNGTGKSGIVRLNSDGSIDNSFSIGSGFNAAVRTIVIQPDGKILVGGDFTSYNGTNRNYLARLNSDGSIDKSFNWGVGFNNSVRSLALQTDGKIAVGGDFTTFENKSALYFITLAVSK